MFVMIEVSNSCKNMKHGCCGGETIKQTYGPLRYCHPVYYFLNEQSIT